MNVGADEALGSCGLELRERVFGGLWSGALAEGFGLNRSDGTSGSQRKGGYK
jgi:hypothetical protein